MIIAHRQYMHAVGSKPVHRSWTLSVLSPIESKTKQNKTKHSWDQVPGASFGVEMIQEVLTGSRKVSKWVLLI